ncbi:sensor histidine kinase [Hymenobacter sp. BT18]|uniref:sensor histidine kinase n=1 Tax=Hymenobacter sp. BT18 TaxID=2835648 RepID=UPI00143E81B0|nr:sensor histidine kinase [Hymenobacter sp. BT18]QIX62587.1 sensor histidine kinase [Hymenobacter sp. BT18]
MDALRLAAILIPIILLLALSIAAFMVRHQRRLMRQQDHLRSVRETAQRQALEAALLAQEEERRRIASDLHDEVGTTLAIVKLHLTALEMHEQTRDMTALLDQAIGEVRRISRNLLPAALVKFGLAFALQSLARAVPAGSTCVELQLHGQPTGLNAVQELAIYRIVQELLGNGLRHAKAAQIHLQVSFAPNRVLISYTDDGVGFDPIQSETPPPPETRTGLGLTNMRSRIELLQGTLRHQSTPGAGTQVWISFPVPYFAAT